MIKKSRIIIVGSGIVGASTAYHLAQLGWKDMVILDQGPLFETGGSTSHAPGGVFQTNPSRMMCKFAQYTVELLRSLTFDGKPCYHTVGGIEVSKSKERNEKPVPNNNQSATISHRSAMQTGLRKAMSG